MPVKMHRALKRAARKKYGATSSPKAKRYIYGALNKHKKKKI
jgi:hypothetical protein